MKNLSYYLMSYLTQYLPLEKGCSDNTIATYRYCFIMLLRFLQQERVQAADVSFEHLDMKTVVVFLDWLEKHEKCSVQTRNNRLAAIRSFAQYVSIQEPQYLYLYQQMKAIPTKKFSNTLINYLTVKEVRDLLASVGMDVPGGLRNVAMLSLLYDSAARVQEVCDLKISDINITQCTVTIQGKGKKVRCVPLMKSTIKILSHYLRYANTGNVGKELAPLFPNRSGQKMTRAGLSYIFKKYSTITCPSNAGSIHPHCLRHSKAMHMLEAGVPLYYIRDFLGHSSIQTTEIYLRGSRAQIKQTLENVSGHDVIPQPEKMSWQNSADLYHWLRAMGK